MAEKKEVREKACSSDHELSSDFVEERKWKGNYVVKKNEQDEPIRKIKVTKLPEETTEDILMNYFENRRRTGGGPIESIELHPATSSAIIEFQEIDAVDRVLKKAPLLFLKKHISVEEYVEEVEDTEEEDEEPSCRTIEVHGFAENASEEVLEMYFENSKRSGGSEVTSVVIEGVVALVTFSDKNVVSSVLQREHTLDGQKLTVTLHLPKKQPPAMEVEEEEDEPLCTIEVRGYKTMSEETLQMYFENTKKSGGDEIIKFEPIEMDRIIFITFASEEVARNVANREHVVGGCSLNVKLYVPPKLKSARNLSRTTSKEPEESVPHCTIEVRGVSNKILSTLQLYFENTKCSGGDEIVNFEYKETDDIAYITFKSEDVAKRVVSHGQHKVEGQWLEVKLYLPPPPRPIYDDRVLLTGFTSKVTQDGLTDFLEAKTGLTPVKYVYGEDEGKVIITFEETIDFEKLEEACKKRPFEGSYLVPSKVHISNSIIISNLKTTTTEDTIQLYFENEKRSWGGPVEKVEFKREEEYCLVFFEDLTICDRVLQRKHKIDGSELQVSIYYESLSRISEDDNGLSFKPPKSLKLEKLEFAEMQFLMRSEPNRTVLEKQFQDCFTQTQWPQTETDCTILTCTLTSDVQDSLKKEAKDEPIRTIKVTKIPDRTEEEALINFFENRRRNGGGPIESIEYHPATSSAIIEFQEADAVDRVLKKRPFLFLKRQISVEEYVEKMEDKKEEEPSCRTIEVCGFAENTFEDVLEMYFENSKRSGGSEVTSVVIEDGVALVTFTDENVASSVCEREHILGGHKLSVSLHLPKKKSSAVDTGREEEADEPVCTVEVRGYKVGSEGTVELYFENTKRSGGDEIVSFDPVGSDQVIFITFASEEVAKRVSERQHLVAGCTLDVKLYEPPKHKFSRKWSTICSKQPEGSVPHCVITVKGVTRRIIEPMPLYFENKRRSGGDEIVKFEYSEENEIAYITYESEEVAQRVVTHGQHKLDGQPLKVKLFIPPQPRPHYEDRVLFVRLNSKITCDGLTNFLEAKVGLTPVEFFFGEEGDKVIIRFNKKIDFEKLEEACKKRPLESSYLVPSRVNISNSIIISNLKTTTTEDTIHLYFENEKRSWGGPVEKVEFKRDEEYCLVFFEDHTICDQVLQRKHKIDGSELQASIYYESLGRIFEEDNGPSFKPPKPLKLKEPKFAKMQFLMRSESTRSALEKQLQDCFTQIQWPLTETDCTILTCTLTSHVRDCKQIALTWAQQAQQNLNYFLNILSVHELRVFKEIFETVLQNLQNLTIANPDGVVLIVCNAQFSIQVVGHKAVATVVVKDIEDIIKKAESDFDRKKKQTKETLTNLK